MQCAAKSKRSGEQCKKDAIPGRSVCHIHGGKSLGGLASPTFKEGRYSKYLPAQLATRYNEARSDPDILSLNEDVALLRSFVYQHLASIADGDAHPAWIAAKTALDEMEKAEAMGASAIDKYLAAKVKLRAVIEPNYRAAIAEHQVTDYIDQLGRIADKERRLLIDRQQVITVERMMLMLTAVIASVKRHVDDRLILNAIQNDIQGLLVAGS